jgi:hypothetical protein
MYRWQNLSQWGIEAMSEICLLHCMLLVAAQGKTFLVVSGIDNDYMTIISPPEMERSTSFTH